MLCWQYKLKFTFVLFPLLFQGVFEGFGLLCEGVSFLCHFLQRFSVGLSAALTLPLLTFQFLWKGEGGSETLAQ